MHDAARSEASFHTVQPHEALHQAEKIAKHSLFSKILTSKYIFSLCFNLSCVKRNLKMESSRFEKLLADPATFKPAEYLPYAEVYRFKVRI